MIVTLRDKDTEDLFSGEGSRRLPPDIVRRGRRKLFAIDAAQVIDDLRMPPGNRLHLLKGNLSGMYAIAINDQWRICFRFAGGNAYDVEVCDYHD